MVDCIRSYATNDQGSYTLVLTQPLTLCCRTAHLRPWPSSPSIPAHILKMRSDIVKQRWTTEEKAFILNWTDYCLYYALDYRKTIMEELRQYSPQNSYDAEKIRAQVCYLARLYRHEGMDAGPVTIYEKGTRYLDAAKMPSDLKRKMNSQRSEWSIGNLDEVDKHIPLKRHKVSVSNNNPFCKSLTDLEKMSKRLPQRAPAKPLHTTPTQPKPTPPTRSNKAHISRSSQEAGPGHIPPESEVDTVIVAQPITVEGSSMVSGPSSPVLRSPTMSAITTHSHTPDLPSSRVTPPNASQDLPTAVSDLFQVVNWMVEGVIKTHARDDVPKHIIDRLISIQRTINADPKVTISRLAQDLVGAEEANATLCRTLGNLAGDQHWLMHLNFPSTPSTADLAETWNVLRSRLQSVDSSTRERAPDLYVAEHLAKRSEKFMSDKSPYPDPLGWVDDLKGLCVSPHAAQTVMSVAFLTSLFPMYPEPIYDQRSWEIPSRLLEMVEHLGTYIFPRSQGNFDELTDSQKVVQKQCNFTHCA